MNHLCPKCGREVVGDMSSVGLWWIECVGCRCVFSGKREVEKVLVRSYIGMRCWVPVGKLFVYDEEVM